MAALVVLSTIQAGVWQVSKAELDHCPRPACVLRPDVFGTAVAAGVMLSLGLGVDVATGAAFTYDPLRVSLKPLPAPAAMAPRPVLAPLGVPRSE